MQRSLQWARGNLINVQDADQILSDLAELLEEIRMAGNQGGQGIISFVLHDCNT